MISVPGSFHGNKKRIHKLIKMKLEKQVTVGHLERLSRQRGQDEVLKRMPPIYVS